VLRRHPLLSALVICIALSLSLIVLLSQRSLPVEEDERKIRRKFAQGEHGDVVNTARNLAARNQLSDIVTLLAGESATKLRNLDEAATFYARVQKRSDRYSVAQLALAEVLQEKGELSKAEISFRNVLEQDSNNQAALSRLASLMMTTGRVSDATPYLRTLLQLRTITWMELGWLAAPDRGINAMEFLQKCQRNAPDDPASSIGIARNLFNRGLFKEAIACTQKLTFYGQFSEQRDLLTLQCQLHSGEPPGDVKDVDRQFQHFRSTAQRDGLFVLGSILEANGLQHDAIQCFAECLRISDHLSASQHLLSLLVRTEPRINLEPLRNRIQLQSRLDTIVRALQAETQNPQAAKEISEIMSQLGRDDEAFAWRAAAERGGLTIVQSPPLNTDIRHILDSCVKSRESLASETKEQTHHRTPVQPGAELSRAENPIMDEAASAGINFSYYESPDDSTIGRRMFEWTGGGTGVLDLDHDTWPDLYFTQGTEWPVDINSSKWLDVVYRNRRGQTFVDVTSVAAIREPGYSQGVSCGDLNNDGFSDLVVCNIGKNSYWANQGDGTFIEFNPLLTHDNSSEAWTTSCAIADLDADGLPDIFEVRYLAGEQISTLICPTTAGPRACSPLAFKPTVDRLLLNNGDGTFQDISAEAGIDFPGNGLGLVITNLDEDPLLEIFIANDAMPNALWDNQSSDGSPPLFEDVASLRGVALNSEGLAQACMGIAADDFNSDGSTDLFVTNFYNEPNAFYVFNSTGFATDEALLSGIRRSSIPMLGFGAQSIDSNCDSMPDIFLANGDIDDFSHEGRPFQMVPQLLVNDGQGRFHEEIAGHTSDIRNALMRGRGVARLDWNNDHQWDLAISCLDSPACLATLRSNSISRFTQVTFIGTNSSRDAIGVQAKDQSGRLQSLHAGDGYMASNQRAMIWPISSKIKLRLGTSPETEITLQETPQQAVVEGRNRTFPLPE
jgi:tetratricopeptide (TPR) repeat protein